jgi:hypothetical protein
MNKLLAFLLCIAPLAAHAMPQEKPAYEQRDQRVTDDDLHILVLADTILADSTKWNRKDDRNCPPEAVTWSLFCALHDASIKVLGKYDHRRVALQEVRFAIEDVTNGKEFEHRMMDYNNLETTRFKDIKLVLKMATDRVAARLKEGDASPALLSQVDHLIYATPDLDRTVSELEKLLGVKATPGGRQESRGTWNALISLGTGAYLEIVAPDPQRPATAQPPWWLKNLKNPRIVAWAVHGTGLEALRANALQNGVPLGEVISGERVRPDGVRLAWRFTSPKVPVADGIVPFFIDWGQSPHPAKTSPQGAILVALRAEHPDRAGVQHMIEQLGVDLIVADGSAPALIATVEGLHGRVEIR